MNLSDYAIQQLVPYVTGDLHSPIRSGRELIQLFNKYGSRDIYDENGLPDIGKKNRHRPSRKEYTESRLKNLSSKPELRELLNQVIAESDKSDQMISDLNSILNPEYFNIVKNGDLYFIQGGAIDRTTPIFNQAHFENIQNSIIHELNSAKVSIKVVVAWFTNKTLFDKLVEKYSEGLDVEIAIYDDGINKKHGVDINLLPHKLIKRGKRGGLMHNKFCIIDNQVVITGSYNWTDNAEFRNDENITVEKDPKQATQFSLEYRELTT